MVSTSTLCGLFPPTPKDSGYAGSYAGFSTAGNTPEFWFRGIQPSFPIFSYPYPDEMNGCYDYSSFDGCAVLCRRLLETLLVEAFVANNCRAEIEVGGRFLMLDDLINKIKVHPNFALSRTSKTSLDPIKQVGDVAAHRRTYIAQKQDIDDIKTGLRHLVAELLVLAKIRA